jgi:hypothetical protein
VHVNTPYGPRQIALNRQITLPKELMDRAHLRPGDQVYIQWNDAIPGTLLVIPVEFIAEWIRIGQLGGGLTSGLASAEPPV